MFKMVAQKPSRITQAIPRHDGDPVPWKGVLPFNILSMDGGGIKANLPGGATR